MPFSSLTQRFSRFRYFLFCLTGTLISLLAVAQTNLAYRLFDGYLFSPDAPLGKGKATLFVCNDADAFNAVFRPATTGRRSETPDFKRDMVIGIVTPITTKPPRLSVSRVFVQDSTLTIRYVRLADTTRRTQPNAIQPLLLFSIPKQTVLRTRLIENGKVVQTLRQTESGAD